MTSKQWNINLQGSVDRLLGLNAIKREDVRNVIEIGCFEGFGTIRLHELFKKDDLKIFCVDPWDEGYVLSNEKFNDINPIFVGQWPKFVKYTDAIKEKLVICRGYSNDVLPTLEKNSIDFIYIDGDHSENQVYLDGKLAFPLMRSGSIMLFDDYNWSHKGEYTKNGIERFISEHQEHVDVVFRGPVQCAVKIK